MQIRIQYSVVYLVCNPCILCPYAKSFFLHGSILFVLLIMILFAFSIVTPYIKRVGLVSLQQFYVSFSHRNSL